MSEEKKAEGFDFENIVSEIKRWAGIVEKTADQILETSPSKKDEKK